MWTSASSVEQPSSCPEKGAVIVRRRFFALTGWLLVAMCLPVQAQHWIPQASGTSQWIFDVCFVNADTGWVTGQDGMIRHTTNGGITWVAQNSGTTNDLRGVSFVDANIGWAVGPGGVIVQTINGGDSWVTQHSGTTSDLWNVSFVDANHGWAVGSNGTIRSTTNGGETWFAQSSGTTSILEHVALVNADTGWVTGYSGRILRTTDGGTTWIPQNSGVNCLVVDISLVDANTAWAVGGVYPTSGTILHTSNGGSTWVLQSSGASYYLDGVEFVDANRGWAVGVGGTILHTTDGGSTWITQNSGTEAHLGSAAFVDAHHGWATGESGTILYYYAPPQFELLSPNGGEQWYISHFDTVRWTSPDYEGPVEIELNRDYPSGEWEILAGSTENDSVEAFCTTEPLSSNCRVRIIALEDTLTDISDADFSITSSQGYLALVGSGVPNTPVLTCNFLVDCPQATSTTFHVKNFGNDAIIVYQPQEPITLEFTSSTSCDSIFALGPSEISACSLSIVFDPPTDGVYHDTLLIRTDAVNQQGGYVRIPLQGQQISTPDTPQVVINIEGNDAHLTWSPITESIFGCPVTVTAYLVFYSPSLSLPYYFHGLTTDTTYVHGYVVCYASGMFYEVIAVTDPLERLCFLSSPPGGTPPTREEVLHLLE